MSFFNLLISYVQLLYLCSRRKIILNSHLQKKNWIFEEIKKQNIYTNNFHNNCKIDKNPNNLGGVLDRHKG